MPTVLVAESDRFTAKLIARRLAADGSPHVIYQAVGRDELREALAARRVDEVLLGCIPGLKRTVDLIRAADDSARIIVTGLGSSPCDWPGIPDGVDEVVIGAKSADGLARIVEGMLSDSVGPAPFAVQLGTRSHD